MKEWMRKFEALERNYQVAIVVGVVVVLAVLIKAVV